VRVKNEVARVADGVWDSITRGSWGQWLSSRVTQVVGGVVALDPKGRRLVKGN
jgi:hypothetical protein